jgi:excisionase family DNA binding protein
MNDLLDAVLDELADRVAERLSPLIVKRVDDGGTSPWLDYQAASEYLTIPVDTLKKSVRTMPHRKVGRRVLFNKQELDAWLDGYFEGPRRATRDRLRVV